MNVRKWWRWRLGVLSEVLYVDNSEESVKVKELLKDEESITIHEILDPSTIDFALPILFSDFGSFTPDKIESYQILKKFYKKN